MAILLVMACGLACSLLRPKTPLTWHVTLEIDGSAPDRVAATRQTIFVIEKRLQALGVSNWAIKVQGSESSGRLLVNLPDVADRRRLKSVLTSGGRLELVGVISPQNPAPVQTYASKQAAVASLNSGGTIPAKCRVLLYAQRELDSALSERWVVVESPAIVDGSELRGATAIPARGASDEYEIAFSLNATGAEKFGSWTGAHINEYLGVVLNDEVKSIAFIKSQISDQGVISGRFTKQSAEDLALVLKSGALPASVKIVEEGVNK
jgi:preprotein translocase subunit SecD